jgi:hypothetical protein
MILIVRAYRAAEAQTWREFTGEERMPFSRRDCM